MFIFGGISLNNAPIQDDSRASARAYHALEKRGGKEKKAVFYCDLHLGHDLSHQKK